MQQEGLRQERCFPCVGSRKPSQHASCKTPARMQRDLNPRLELSVQVVVKLIEHGAGVLGKEKERGRLARVEACLSRMLLHPNIVLTYDACTGNMAAGRLAKMGAGGRGGGGYLGGRGRRQRCMTVMVQEFCELGTLRDAINKRKHGLDGWVVPRARVGAAWCDVKRVGRVGAA